MRYRGRKSLPLPAYAHPRACSAMPVEEMVRRHLRCRCYGPCLQKAVENEWEGFDCVECTGYEPMTASELKREMHGLVGILGEICRRERA